MPLLVTIGTDGNTNWVRLPSGERMNLGAVSVLSFVHKAAKNARAARAALDGFLSSGEAMVSVDEERMWALLTPVRARWASGVAGPFMTPDPRTTRARFMSINEKALSDLETHVAALNKFASKASPKKLEEGRAILASLARKVVLAGEEQKDQAQAQEEPKDEQKAQEKPEEKSQQQGDKEASLSYDVIVANRGLADSILAKADETVKVIDRLASEGKKFNAARAKADVHAVTSKVAGIIREDLTQSWVGQDLHKLAAQADKLHGLFIPKKA